MSFCKSLVRLVLDVVARPAQHDQILVQFTASTPVGQMMNVEMVLGAAVEASALRDGQGATAHDAPVLASEVARIRHPAQLIGVFAAFGPEAVPAVARLRLGLVFPDVPIIVAAKEAGQRPEVIGVVAHAGTMMPACLRMAVSRGPLTQQALGRAG